MRRVLLVAASAAFVLPAAPALAQYGGSPEQQVDGPPPSAAMPGRAVAGDPEDRIDSAQDVDRDVDIDPDPDPDRDVDIDPDPDDQAEAFVSLEPGAAGQSPAEAAPAAPAARSEGYVRLRPGDRYDLRGGGPAPGAWAPNGPKDEAFDDRYDAESASPDGSGNRGDKDEAPDQPEDEDAPATR